METTQKNQFLRIVNPGTAKYYGKNSLFILCLLLLQSIFLSHEISAQYCEKDKEVMKVYKLRPSGNINSAWELLATVLKEDSTNALANFEMARTVEDKDKWKYIDRAIHYDPENPMYVFYKANLYILNAYVAMRKSDKGSIMHSAKDCCKTLHEVLEINPGCKESLLFLVDLYGNLPEDMVGNPDQAKKNWKL